MAAQPKPLRFLFSKYAALAPNKVSQLEAGRPHGTLRPMKLPQWSKAGSLSDLHLLESDISQSKLERIQVFLALSDVPGRSPPSVVGSSVGTSITHDTASREQSRGRPRIARGDRGSTSESPTRFRSKSQEFENMYRLAASRCSHDVMKGARLGNSAHQLVTSFQNGHSPTNKNNHTKRIQFNGKDNYHKKNTLSLKSKRPESANSNDLSIRGEEAAHTRGITQVMIEERRNNNGDGYGSLRPAHTLSYSYQDLNIMIGGNYPTQAQGQRGASAKLGKRREETGKKDHRIQAGQLPRCPSLSTVDADRLDSSCYHYLLEELTSSSGSSTLSSGGSSAASSKVSARAQRPSTSGTEATAQRLRNLHTRTTDLSSPPSQVQSILPPGVPGIPAAPGAPSNCTRSPELPWPPRYALNPPWTTYEDTYTQNGPILGYSNRRSRRCRDREKYRKTGALWGRELAVGHPRGKIHVVPSHVNTECEQCNMHNTQCAKHLTRTQRGFSSSPLSNGVQTADGNHSADDYSKSISSSHSNPPKKDHNGARNQTKLYLPPPTATTTHSSLNVNIGIKEPYSASTSRTRVTANSMKTYQDKSMLNSRPTTKGTLVLDKPKKPSLYLENASKQNHTMYSPPIDPSTRHKPSFPSDHREQFSQQRRSGPSVAYSWERASKVSFVNTTV